MLSKSYVAEELAYFKDQLMDSALLEHELTNGDNKKAREVIKAIQTFDRIIKEAWEEREKYGHFRW